jgi:aminoglycoside phosphotransferase (APT) family kinase protein
MGTVKLVLRKQPPGKLLASAHAVHREFAVMKALAKSPVPVPRTLTLCRDPSVLGADFYTMEFVDGPLFLEPSMAGSTPERRARVYRAMAGVVLHKVLPSSCACTAFIRRFAKLALVAVSCMFPQIIRTGIHSA